MAEKFVPATKEQIAEVLIAVQKYMSALTYIEDHNESLDKGWEKRLARYSEDIVESLKNANILKTRKKDEFPQIKKIQGIITGKMNSFKKEESQKANPDEYKKYTSAQKSLKELRAKYPNPKDLVGSKEFKDLSAKIK